MYGTKCCYTHDAFQHPPYFCLITYNLLLELSCKVRSPSFNMSTASATISSTICPAGKIAVMLPATCPTQMRRIHLVPCSKSCSIGTTPAAQVLDLGRLSVPVADVLVGLHPQWPSTQHQRALRPIEATRDYLLLVLLAAAGLNASHEPRATHTRGTLHEAGRETAPIADATGRHYEGRLAAKRLGPVSAEPRPRRPG